VAYAELIAVERNRLTFQVEAYDAGRKIGEGTHKRAIIKTGGESEASASGRLS